MPRTCSLAIPSYERTELSRIRVKHASADDRAVTRQIVDGGRLLDIPCYDHMIIAGERYVSLAEAGL